MFEVVTAQAASRYGMAAEQLRVRDIPTDCVAIVTMLDGASIPAGDLAGPSVPGHDSFQKGQAFIEAGGCRGLQEQVLLAGSWNLNPWRSDRQREAFGHIRDAIAAYDVECIDTLIGDIEPPAELMKTQTDRKIPEELQVTYDVQRQAQVQRQSLERETAIAGMQSEVVRSEQMVQIAEKNALAVAESAKGEAAATRLRAEAQAVATRATAEAEAAATRFHGEAEGDATRALGNARAEAYKAGVGALGPDAVAAMQLATVLGENHVKLVPDIAVSVGDSGPSASRVANVLIGKMLASGTAHDNRKSPDSGGT